MSDLVPLTKGPLLEELYPTDLNTRVVAKTVTVFECIDSTNTFALAHGTPGQVIVADRQDAGRGRLGRSWHSAPGLGLWFTIVLGEAFEGLTFAAALAVRDAVADRCALTVKWPNDLLLAGMKVCGILTEQRGDRVAVGVGINVHHTTDDFPEELREVATSLQRGAPGAWNRKTVLAQVLNKLDERIILLKKGNFDDLRNEWAEACDLKGRRVRWNDVEGVVVSIDRAGALEFETDTGIQRVVSGDLTYLDRTSNNLL